MSPKEANVFLAEDSVFWRERAEKALTAAGHSVVIIAHTIAEADAAVPQLPNLGVNVALVDGNLSLDPITPGQDGQEIAADIRALAPGVEIVGISADEVPWADLNACKGSPDFERIGEIVTNL